MSERIKQLKQERTHLGPLLERSASMTLWDYAREMVATNPASHPFIHRDRSIVADVLRSHLKRRFQDQEIEEIVHQYLAMPLLQTADHSELLYNPKTLLNNVVFQMGVAQTPAKYLLVQQCSTPRMLQGRNPLHGPGYIDLVDGQHRVFEKSKNTLNDSNVATLRDVTFTFEPEKPGERSPLPVLLQELKGRTYDTAAAAFLEANKYIWDQLSFSQKRELVLFDETLSSDVLASMLEDETHPLRHLLFEPRALQVFRQEIASFVDSPESLALKNSTDFFTGQYDQELIPLKFSEDGTELTAAFPRKRFSLKWEPESIIQALRQRKIYPNLILSMLAVGIFPLATVVGGPSQHEYVPEVQQVLYKTAQQLGTFPEDYIQTITSAHLSSMVEIISRTHPVVNVIKLMDRGTDLSQWEQQLEGSLVGDLVDDYSNFDYFDLYFARREQRRRNNDRLSP